MISRSIISDLKPVYENYTGVDYVICHFIIKAPAATTITFISKGHPRYNDFLIAMDEGIVAFEKKENFIWAKFTLTRKGKYKMQEMADQFHSLHML